jgi:hypothetical protein
LLCREFSMAPNMANNPRIPPGRSRNAAYGAAAISLGEEKLGAAVLKCRDEVKLIYDLPDNMPKEMVMRKLYANLGAIIGIPKGE